MVKRIVSYVRAMMLSDEAFARKIGVKVGDNCRIYTRLFGSEPFLINIGNNVTVTTGVSFITHDGSGWLMRDAKGRRFIYQRIQVGNNVFIGVNSIILPGVVIEDKVIIAAGSVVAKSVPTGCVVGGVPARVIGSFDDLEKKMLDNYVSQSELDYSLSYEKMVSKVIDPSVKEYLINIF